MYSNPAAAAGAGVQTFNPPAAVASDTPAPHQMPPGHSLPAANSQQYYSLPAQPQISTIAPGAPMTGYAQQYNMAGGQGYQGQPPAQTVPGGPAGYQQTPTQMYMPASATAQQAPPGSAAAEYQPYNMHGTLVARSY